MDHSETNNAPSTGAREVTIEKMIYGGQGLARLDGRVAFVPFVLPGETVQIQVERERPGLLEARLVDVVHPAAERVDPPCPFFYRCGGCQYQHASYEAQLREKIAILRDVFRRIGKMELPEQIGVISGEPWGYRNRTQLHLQNGELGYFETGSHRLCPIDRCPISSPKINEAIRALREMMRDRRFPRFVKSIELFTNEERTQVNITETEQGVSRHFFEWCEERIPGAAAQDLEYPAAGRVYRVGRRSFFQVNRFLVDKMVEDALANADEGDFALDLYAGAGLFSLPMAGRFKRIIAIESGGSAIRDLEFNAARAGAAVRAVRGSADLALDEIAERPDFVLADPPRAGLGKRVTARLLRLKPARMTIVSCDPATLARDLAPLLADAYSLERISLIDLFPHTFHIETITYLRAK